MKAISTLLLLVLASSVMGQTYAPKSQIVTMYAMEDPTGITWDDPKFIKVGQKSWKLKDTIPVTLEIQYTRRDVPMVRDCYLINGIPYSKSTALLTRGRWIRIPYYRYRISNGWVNKQN